MMAFIEVRGYQEFKERVEKYGSRWDDDIHLLFPYSYKLQERMEKPLLYGRWNTLRFFLRLE